MQLGAISSCCYVGEETNIVHTATSPLLTMNAFLTDKRAGRSSSPHPKCSKVEDDGFDHSTRTPAGPHSCRPAASKHPWKKREDGQGIFGPPPNSPTVPILGQDTAVAATLLQNASPGDFSTAPAAGKAEMQPHNARNFSLSLKAYQNYSSSQSGLLSSRYLY